MPHAKAPPGGRPDGAAAHIGIAEAAERSPTRRQKQADLFAPPRPRSKRELRRAKAAARAAWRAAVEGWARCVLTHDLLLEYADPANELTVISADGSGPPAGWRSRILAKLAADLGDALPANATDCQLVKLAIRVGRLPRSTLATMPPRPPELAP